MGKEAATMKLYDELAAYWPLVSAPHEYAEEARVIADLLDGAADQKPRQVLEIGSGGGNLASQLRARYAMTLSDVSPAMLATSRALNPSSEHVEGDMRTLRLGRVFDGIIIHDAIMYMTTETDLRAALTTAFLHCRPGGAALFAPDCVAETFSEETSTGGHDRPAVSVRYMEWSFDPDPKDTTFETHYAFLIREHGNVRVVHDAHVHGLFRRAAWLRILRDVGFSTEVVTDEWGRELMVARRPG